MKGRPTRAYFDDFGTPNSVPDLEALTALEVIEALDEEREDPLLDPWKRGYKAAIRAAMGR